MDSDSVPGGLTTAQVAEGVVAPDLSAYRIAYFEAAQEGEAGENESSAPIAESDEPFTIVDFGPRDVLPQEIKKASIYVVFSHAVVPLAKLGAPVREDAGVFTITPPLKGVYRWYGSRLLSFEPDEETIPQQQYTITVSDKIKSLGGKSLTGARGFSFETERLSVLHWYLGDGNSYVQQNNAAPADAKVLRIIFSYPVNLTELQKWIEVRQDTKRLPFTLSFMPTDSNDYYSGYYKPEQCVLLQISETLPLNADVQVALLSGARSEPGWLGSQKEQVFKFHTAVPFVFSGLYVRSDSYARTQQADSIRIRLEFNQELDTSNIEQYFSIEGMPALTKDNIQVYGSTASIYNLPLEYEHNYRVHISENIKDTYGRSLGRPQTLTAQVGAANSYVYIRNNYAKMLEAAFPPKIIWETQNPFRLFQGIAKSNPYERVDSNLLKEYDIGRLKRNAKNFLFDDLLPYLSPSNKGTVGFRWQYQIPSSWYDSGYAAHDEWLTVQVTDIGITTRFAYNTAVVWATHLSSGSPVAGAAVYLREGDNIVKQGMTDSQGLAVFEFAPGEFASRFSSPSEGRYANPPAPHGFNIQVVENNGSWEAGGDEVLFYPNESHNKWRYDVDGSISPFEAEKNRPVIFLFTDRGLYRPGETMSFRGIDRNLSAGRYSAFTGDYGIQVLGNYSEAPLIKAWKGRTSENGGSYGSVDLPADLDPGSYTIRYIRGSFLNNPGFLRGEIPNYSERYGTEATVETISFIVANFEPLRFQASLTFPDLLAYLGDRIAAGFTASYLSGGGLRGAPVSYYWEREPASFDHGGRWDNWAFGPGVQDSRSYISSGSGDMGPDGNMPISLETKRDGVEGAPYRYRLEASVQDAARQEISSRASFTVHPASYYIGAHIKAGAAGAFNVSPKETSAYILEANKPASVSYFLADPEAKPYAGTLKGEMNVQFVRIEWKQTKQAGIGSSVNRIWERTEEIVEEQKVNLEQLKTTRTEAGAVYAGVLNFTPKKSGQWAVRLRARDNENRPVVTMLNVYVSGAGWVFWGSDDVDSIQLTPDRGTYAPGETAKVLVRSPLPEGKHKYLLTVEREGIFSQELIELDGSARTIDIPIKEDYLPIVYVALSSYTVRTETPKWDYEEKPAYYTPDLDKPKGVFGLALLRIDSESRHYQVEITNSKNTYRPAEEAEVTLTVTQNGRTVPNAELSFMAVDRGVVDLIDYHVSDPLAYFYSPYNFPLGVEGADSRSLLIDPVTYTLADLQGGDSEDDSKMAERKDFRPTAVFEPFLKTGADGTVKVKFKLPDSLTTYRCTAVAVGLDNFGIKEEDLQVSAPLTALAALPRKLRWRDTGTASLILNNLEKEAVKAEVSLAITPLSEPLTGGLQPIVLEVDGESSKTVTIAPQTSVEVIFTIAAVGSGNAQLAFTLKSPQVNERILKELEVERPVLYETVTTIGNLGSDRDFVEEGVMLPANVTEGTGRLTVTLAASRLAQLKDAVGYLLDYPYGCLEQRTARLLPITAFGEYIDSFGLETRVTNVKKVIETELAQISTYVLSDGSFPYWPGGSRGDIFVTLRVAHIAILARQKGYTVPETLNVAAALAFYKAVQSQRFYAQDNFLEGYSLWLRAMNGERIGAEIDTYLRKGDRIGICGYSFAGLAYVEMGNMSDAQRAQSRIQQFVRPGTRTLDLTDTYESTGSYWEQDSDRYALALMLYQAILPNDDMTTRLATALIEPLRKGKGKWSNTATSFWGILAFGRIADAETALATNLNAKAELNQRELVSGIFNSYMQLPLVSSLAFTDKPLDELERDKLIPLRLSKSGTGKLYYTASLRYGMPAEMARARDEGISVFVETLDSDGTAVTKGILIPGQTYTRRITLSTSKERTYVALRSPIPSGAEILDATFVTSSSVPALSRETETEYESYWDYIHNAAPLQFIMDNEVRYHWDFLPAGQKQVEYRFRAVMPGVYPTPPATAECMYEEEVFGRSAGELVRIVTIQE
ncbi:alpha-2-macroglobulin family protein [Breznakiellaceae bacterium SP9]